jgi:hypothetical protein
VSSSAKQRSALSLHDLARKIRLQMNRNSYLNERETALRKSLCHASAQKKNAAHF